MPASGTAEIFVPQQGTVTKVHVAEDQTVNQGDVLLTIDTSQVTADGLDVNAAMLKSLSMLWSAPTKRESIGRAKDPQRQGREPKPVERVVSIAEPNRIFGFGAWDRRTISTACVWSGQAGMFAPPPTPRRCG